MLLNNYTINLTSGGKGSVAIPGLGNGSYPVVVTYVGDDKYLPSVNDSESFIVSKVIIGLTVISIGTSMPELFVSIAAAQNGHADISIGNVIGSNILNILLILGTSTMFHSLNVKDKEDFVSQALLSAFWPLALIAAPFLIIGYIGYWATKKLYK